VPLRDFPEGETKLDLPLKITVAIATAGRPGVLEAMLLNLASQVRRPDRVIVCAPEPSDVEGLSVQGLDLQIKLGVRGSCIQRNIIIQESLGDDVIVFFDDDFIAAPEYLASVAQVFARNADVAVATGHVIVDGIIGPGLSLEDAKAAVAADGGGSGQLEEVYNGYGCNMAVRVAALREHSIFFDEALPLYGWLEDVDLSRRLSRFGRIVRMSDARGVHLGVKRGRQRGNRLGYSQVANPYYLARKGTLSWGRALRQIGRNLAANAARSLHPEPYVDRRGRVAGNAKALFHLITGKLDPRRVLEL
jgi:hypothetical protein